MGKKAARTFQAFCRGCLRAQYVTMHHWEVLGDKRCTNCQREGMLITKDIRFVSRRTTKKVLDGQLALPLPKKETP